MPPLLVRLNLPDFKSPELFKLASAPPSVAELTCSVLEQIGGFSQDELNGVRHNLDSVPLQIHGELCAGQLVHLSNDAELEVFLTTATSNSPRGLATVEVRPSCGDAHRREETSFSLRNALPNAISDTGVSDVDAFGDREVSRSGQFPAGKPASPAPIQDATLRREVQPVTSSRSARSHSGGPRSIPIPMSAPPGERKLPWEAHIPTRERGDKPAQPASTFSPMPEGLERLYRDAEERKLKLDEARRRHCQEEKDQLLAAKQQALGRASVLRSGSEPNLRSASQNRREQSAERSHNAALSTRNRMKDSSCKRGTYFGTYAPAHDAAPSSWSNQVDCSNRLSASVEASPTVSLCSSVPPPSPGAIKTSRKIGGQPKEDSGLPIDAKHQRTGNDGNRLCSADLANESLDELRRRAEVQQQRIDFLENINQQSLRQLRRAREETSQAQQQRFQEADKVLSLEHLVSEMQSLCFQDAATPWCQDWLRRSAAILSDKSD